MAGGIPATRSPFHERRGRIVGASLSDYIIPLHADMPVFDVHMIEEDDPHLGGGIKGIRDAGLPDS